MFRRMLLVLIVLLGATGCSQEESTPTPLPEQIIETGTTVKAEPEMAEPTPETETPLPAAEEATPTSATEVALAEPTLTAIPTREEETSGDDNGEAQENPAVFNGVYGESYFRGAETAPVTIIDYSDFL